MLIAPDSRFGPFEIVLQKERSLSQQMSKTLSQLDTGIARLGDEFIELDNLPLQDKLQQQLVEKPVV